MPYAVLESIAAAPPLVLLVSQRPPSRPTDGACPDGPGGEAAPPLPRSAWPTRIRGSSVKGSDRPKRPNGRPQVGRARLIRVQPLQRLLGRSDAWDGALIALCHVAGAAPACQAARQTPVARTEESMEMSFFDILGNSDKLSSGHLLASPLMPAHTVLIDLTFRTTYMYLMASYPVAATSASCLLGWIRPMLQNP
jgi:hypothetical protein